MVESITLTCDCCGKEFQRAAGTVRRHKKAQVKHQYCTLACRGRRARAKTAACVTLTCGCCGKPFVRRVKEINKNKKRGIKRQFCSRACKVHAQTVTEATVVVYITLICAHCKKEFKRTATHIDKNYNHSFCSTTCYHSFYTGEIVSINCSSCNKAINRKKRKISKKSGRAFCNRLCAAAYNSANKRKPDVIVTCVNCGKSTGKSPSFVRRNPTYHYFCCRSCSSYYNRKNPRTPRPPVTVPVTCTCCGKPFNKNRSQIRRSKSSRYFCGQSCAAIYNNAHKTKGYSVSKLELYMQAELPKLFPSLEFIFNGRTVIKSELDIYIPSLKLGIEINGPVHYSPIFGAELLARVQNKDARKKQVCMERGIEFYTVDSSAMGYFKLKNAESYLDIVVNLINMIQAREQTQPDLRS